MVADATVAVTPPRLGKKLRPIANDDPVPGRKRAFLGRPGVEDEVAHGLLDSVHGRACHERPVAPLGDRGMIDHVRHASCALPLAQCAPLHPDKRQRGPRVATEDRPIGTVAASPGSTPCTRWQRGRVGHLLLAACLAYLWVIYLGVCAIRDDWLHQLHRHDRCDLSLFRLELRLLARCLKEALPIPDGFLVPANVPAAPRSPGQALAA